MWKRCVEKRNYGEQWVSFPGGSVNIDAVLLQTGIPVQAEKLHEGLFQDISVFYVCDTCGKVYWDGSHGERLIQKFGRILRKERPISQQKTRVS